MTLRTRFLHCWNCKPVPPCPASGWFFFVTYSLWRLPMHQSAVFPSPFPVHSGQAKTEAVGPLLFCALLWWLVSPPGLPVSFKYDSGVRRAAKDVFIWSRRWCQELWPRGKLKTKFGGNIPCHITYKPKGGGVYDVFMCLVRWYSTCLNIEI